LARPAGDGGKLAEHAPRRTKVKGSNLAAVGTSIEREKMQKKFLEIFFLNLLLGWPEVVAQW
jgi:hypothetical protein